MAPSKVRRGIWAVMAMMQ